MCGAFFVGQRYRYLRALSMFVFGIEMAFAVSRLVFVLRWEKGVVGAYYDLSY